MLLVTQIKQVNNINKINKTYNKINNINKIGNISQIGRDSQVAQTVKNLPAMQETQVQPQKIPWRREWIPTPVLAGYSPWGRKELDMTEGLTLSHVIGKSSSQKQAISS